MTRRDILLGALAALFTIGANMTPENERRAVRALESIAKSLADIARSTGTRTFSVTQSGDLQELDEEDHATFAGVWEH